MVDMSTLAGALSHQGEIECGHDLHAFLRGLEDNSSLFQPENLLERLTALDNLDSAFGNLDSAGFTSCVNSPLYRRAKALQTRLESTNARLYQSIRSEIVHGGQSRMLLQWLSRNESTLALPGLGFDSLDELVSGVLQLPKPSEPNLPPSPEMVPYQPTPVRHILQLITASALVPDDIFVDLGSGLGHVPLLVSVMTGAQSVGIEVQSAYVASARKCARSLDLSRVRFIAQDAREADLSGGTVFYLYSPFNGSILADVLSKLRKQSTRRSITICSLGPCTRMVGNQIWLKARALPYTRRIAVFDSR